MAEETRLIVERWYEWTQEFFCDAVGLTIGDESYARAFSTYLRMLGRDKFHLPKFELEVQPHPVTWLRIRVMADRLRAGGADDIAVSLENEWQTLAEIMGVTEDYFGFYTDDFLVPLQRTLTDMLIEAAPVGLDTPSIEASAVEDYINPVPVLVEAWHRFLSAPDSYRGWELEGVKVLLKGV